MFRHREKEDLTTPEIRVGEDVKEPTATTVRIEGKGTQPVRLNQRLDVRAIQIHSVSNDNQRFFIRVGLGKMKPGTLVYLGFEGRWWHGGLGTTATDSHAIFHVDRAAALAIAAAWSVTAHERSRLDTGLRQTWRFTNQVVPGQPFPLTLQIVNEGTTALTLSYCPYWLQEMEASRDGSPVEVTARIYSGPSHIAPLPPGASAILSDDLREVISLDQPGRYEITARFRGHLVRDGMSSMDANLSGAAWDVCWGGRGVVLVS